MFETVLTFLQGLLLLIFGFVLTPALSGLRASKRNCLIFFSLFAFSGLLQLVCLLTASEEMVWKLYPLIVHLPLILLLCLVYRKPLITAAVSVFTSYLCCVPSKWFGVLFHQLTGSATAELLVRILFLFPVGYVSLFLFAPCLCEIFNKDRRSVCIFGLVPTVYYLFDYITAVYTDLWHNSERLVMESLPFILAATHLVFCVIYYKEYEQKADAQRKEQIIQITVEQQAKEIAAINQASQELRLLRHDMRMFLSSLAISIQNGELDTAQQMINTQISHIDGTKLVRYCSNDIVNYVISDYAARCKNKDVDFSCSIRLDTLNVDEIMFSSILSNALDNALDAQKLLPPERRSIRLMIQHSGGKLLLSVKNAVGRPVIFSDGLPVSIPERHGHGTQSIRYLTERLGGNCQFSAEGDTFILRVVL